MNQKRSKKWLLCLLLLIPNLLPAKEILVALPTEGAPLVEIVNGELKGMIGDVSKILFTKMGYTYKLEKYPFPRLYAMLQDGTVDVALRVLASEKRRKLAWYSDPIITEYQTIVVKKGRAFPFAKLSDLNGKTLGVIRGFIYPVMDGRNEIRLEAGIDNAMNARKLLADRVDAIIVNSIFGLESLKTDGFLDKVEILPNAAAPVPLGIGLAMSKFSDAERREINQIIHEILHSPQWTAILKSYGLSQWQNDYPLVKNE